MEEPADAGVGRRGGEVPGGVDAARLKVPPGAPVSDLGRRVVDRADALDGPRAGGRVGQVAGHQLDPQTSQKRRVGAGADQGADPPAAGHEPLGDVAPQQAGRAGDQVVGAVVGRSTHRFGTPRGDSPDG